LVTISSKRAAFGAVINRLQHQVNWIAGQLVMTKAARGQISSADMAHESSQLAIGSIQQQAAMAIAAQANVTNQVASTVLSALPIFRR